MLVTLACIVILAVILMQSMSNVKGTGASNNRPITVASHVDRTNLQSIYQGLATETTMSGGGTFPMPGAVSGGDKSMDTTANLYALLIAKEIARPSMLISEREQSPNVFEDTDYDYNAYRPIDGIYWDPNFKADLYTESNVSFGHMPLIGRRVRDNWTMGGSTRMPVFGSRGPLEGKPATESMTCDPQTGEWAGVLAYADGHVEWTNNMNPTGTDNIFLCDEVMGDDAYIAFVIEMFEDDFIMQHD